MAILPSFESALLGVHSGLGLKPRRDLDKSRFRNLKLNLQNHAQLTGELLDDIFEALEMDGQACKDARGNLLEWANFHKHLELNTWTGNASEKQLLWHLLAYSYVPGMARRLAFWALHNVKNKLLPMDAGMPGGKFWYLPHWDKEIDKLDMPVPQVIDWLLDLLGTTSFDGFQNHLERERFKEKGDDEAVIRNLKNWRNGTKPQSAELIYEIFSENVELTFGGAFLLDENLALEEQFKAALALVQNKGLNAQTLQNQIPMEVARLNPVLNGNAPETEKQKFVRLIALRYAIPSMATIRQRLRVARMAQEGYKSLMKALCGKEIDATCTDPAKNKLLQLLVLFQNVYNLTIAASENADSVEDQDAWFEAQFAPWDSADLLLSIMPSHRETSYLDLGKRLTRKFMALELGSPLEDLVPLDEGNAKEVIQRRLLGLKQEYEEDIRLMTLVEKVRQSSPWRALEAEPSYWVVSQFVHTKNLAPTARALGVKRLREMATTPGQTVGAIVLELGFLLNGEPRQRPKDIQQRVQSLLDEAKASAGYDEWKAPLLRLRAKHWLMQNEFETACKDFKSALAACSERGFGGVRGEIARDGLATDIVVNGFIPQNQEVYYRDMLRYDMFPDGMASIQDTAVWCDEFFWNDLYHPYPGFERRKRPAKEALEAALVETFGLIENADWDGLGLWLKKYAKTLRKPFKDPRCDSVLTLWLKMLHTFESKLPEFKTMLPNELAGEFEKIEKHLLNRRHAIGLLLDAWPEQAKIADFKGQTPLMLVADNGDAELTRRLLPISEVEAQDYLGRTALHSAVSGRSPECVALVIDHYFQTGKAGFDNATGEEENTALHTAVRFGQPECVRLIFDAFPSLMSQANAAKQTPLDMALNICEDLVAWQTYMHKANRRTGSKEDFELIISTLEAQMV